MRTMLWLVTLALLLSGILLTAVVTYRSNKIAVLSERSLPSEYAVQEGPRDPTTTVFLVGDSQIAHWPLDCHGDWTMVRSGYPGEATPNIAKAAIPLIHHLKPKLVFIISGGNDLSATSLLPKKSRGEAIARSLRSFQALITASVEAGADRVWVARAEQNRYGRLLQWLLWADDVEGSRRDFNAGLDALCTGRCRLLSLKETLGVNSRSDWDRVTTDGIHLNRAAYERLSALIDGVLQ